MRSEQVLLKFIKVSARHTEITKWVDAEILML
jgi:hypothetical protein